jgi:NAD(P)H dehydrogenase (quinone)
MTEPADLPLLVTGASGKLGRLILTELIEVRNVPPSRIIATTRRPADLADFAAKGVVVRRADFDDPASLVEAFAGAERALIISTTPEAPYVPGKRLIQQSAAIAAAVAANVPHIIYTSAPNPEPGTPCFWKSDHYKTELALKQSGATWTVLRHWEWPDWHLAETWTPALAAGKRFAATGEGRCAYISREDTARADAGALLSDDVANRCLDVTGPEALTVAEVMGLMSEASGKPVEVVQVSAGQLADKLADAGANPDFIPVLVAFDEGVGLGLYDGVTDVVAELSGRKPATLRDFFERQDIVIA